VGIELEHGQQLHRCNAQLLEIGNLFDEAGERAAGLFREAGARMTGEAAHVHLVHDGPRRRSPQRQVALPVVRGDVDDHALHGRPRVVAIAPRGVATIRLWNTYSSAIGIQEKFSGIEAQAARRIERALDAIGVQLAGSYTGHEDVPVVVRAVDRRIEANHARGFGVVDPIEQQQLHPGAVSREDAEIDAIWRWRRSQRRATTFLDHPVAHGLPRSSLADAATRSGSKPNFS